jgi:curli biogenesis system outer membrane secretion channel CsgG
LVAAKNVGITTHDVFYYLKYVIFKNSLSNTTPEPHYARRRHMKRIAILAATFLTLAYSGITLAEKPRMGVSEFNNTATGTYWWGGGVGWELSSMLTNELANTKKFRMVERSKLEPVLQEQNLAAGGRIAKGTGAQIGKLTGAQYLVMGTVSAFENNVAATGGGLTFSGIRLGGKKKSSYIAVDLRVVDTTSGEIAFNRTVEARSGGFGINLGFFKNGLGGSLANEKKTPAGKAIRAVIVEITDYLTCAMVDKGSCMEEFDAKENKRREGLKKGITLD